MRFFRNTEFNQQKNKVSGYACVFEKESITLSDPYNGSYRKYTEIIHRGAITQETINNSDIFATLDHDTGYIVARSRNGNGSLHLSVDDKGLYFEFELPKTEKGNEIRSYLERGEINQCSFCFDMDIEDETAQKWSIKDGSEYREIFKIRKLYDIALVFQPAYPDSSVSLRKAIEEEKVYISEQINKLNTEYRDMEQDQKQEQENNLKEIEALKAEIKELKEEQLEKDLQELDEKVAEIDEKSSENDEKVVENEEKTAEVDEKVDEKEEEMKEEKSEKGDEKEQISEENSEKQQKSDDIQEDNKQEEKTEDKQKKNNRNIYMKQQNFLLKEIRNALENGKRSFSFPAMTEHRTVTVNDQGESPNVVAGVHDEIIDTEIQGILEPLYADSILFNGLGCRVYKGLPMGDIQIPAMTSTSSNWAGEIDEAQTTGVQFSHVTLSPKRITTQIEISKLLLRQDTHAAEEAIRRDLVNSLNNKLQETFFGVENKSDIKPIGVFYNKELVEVEDFADIADLEATVDDANIKGSRKYVGSHKAKAAFRVMAKSALTNELMMNAGEIDGTQYLATSSIADKKFIYGNFEDGIALASWGDTEIIVDPYSTAARGTVRIILNGYFDWCFLRPEALVFGKIKE